MKIKINRKIIFPLAVIIISFIILITSYIKDKSPKASCAAKVSKAANIEELMDALNTYCTKEEAARLLESFKEN